MTSERSKRRDFLSLIFIAKSISKKLLIKIYFIFEIKSLFRSSSVLISLLHKGSKKVMCRDRENCTVVYVANALFANDLSVVSLTY